MMGLQAIEAAPKNGNPVFLADQDAGDITAAHRTVRQGAPVAKTRELYARAQAGALRMRGSGSKP
jgi:hypothetical protein